MERYFDFSHSADLVRACFALPEEKLNEHLTATLFQAPELPEFLAAYLSKPLEPQFLDNISIHENYLPGNGLGNLRATGISLGGIYIDYKDEAISRDDETVRHKSTYPLTLDEVHIARQYLTRNIELHIGILLIKEAIAAYLEAWENYLLSASDNDIFFPVEDMLSDLKVASSGFTFPHDLTPQFALGFGLKNKNFSDINSADYREALVSIFRKQAMKSRDKDGITVCPFSSSFAKVFSLKPIMQQDGHLKIVQGEFGDLLRFAGQKAAREIDADARDDYVHYFAV